MAAHSPKIELLTTRQMYAADKATIERGTPGKTLMENAGAAIVRAVRERWAPREVVVLCGPGNNGGDGFVAARLLKEASWPVRLALLGEVERLEGDAAHHAGLWEDKVESLGPKSIDGAELIIDALFGAGLSRPLQGKLRRLCEAINDSGIPVLAVDTPSGVAGDTGDCLGGLAVRATTTVTFFRKKPGHLLMPGRLHCGEVVLSDIGIDEAILPGLEVNTFENVPDIWADRVPSRALDGHKYRYGHAVVIGGGTKTGAGRLASRAALRVGAGLVTVAAPSAALPIYAATTASVITQPVDEDRDLTELLSDRRRNAVLIGPGNGVTDETRRRAEFAMAAGKAVVLDADALSVFENDAAGLAAAEKGPTVLTPHEGEFARVFPDLKGDRLERARTAAYAMGVVILLKGADTVIVDPDGRAAVNANAPAELATAGAGDVLAGMICGLLAQGVPAFEAAAAGAWLHGRAAQGFGPGLIAEDLPDRIPAALAALQASRK